MLLQWAVGGMAFCWFTTRRREVGLGYGWLLRGVYAIIAFGALAAGLLTDPNPVREASAAATGTACLVVLAVSVRAVERPACAGSARSTTAGRLVSPR